MTKLEPLDIDLIPDVLEWKREIQEAIYQETKNRPPRNISNISEKGARNAEKSEESVGKKKRN